MSRILLSCFVALLASTQAHAESEGEWTGYLVRTETPGFVIPGSGLYQRCIITPDDVVIERSVGTVLSTEHRTLSTEGDFGALVRAAAAGDITQETAPTDIPLQIYMAIEILPSGDQRRVDLGSRDDGAFTHNDAPEARGLKHYIDSLCPASN
jgi:hypothetical protein